MTTTLQSTRALTWPLTIAGLNVSMGGFDSYQDLGDSPRRLGALAAFVQDAGADIAGLSDTFRWHEIFKEEEIAAIFGFNYCYRISLGGNASVDQRIGVTLLSQYLIYHAEPVLLADRNCIKAIIELSPGGMQIVVYVVYADSFDEELRKKEFIALRNDANAYGPDVPIAIMGDLNTVKLEDGGITRRLARLAAPLQSRNIHMKSLAQAALGTALPILLEAGFEDAFAGAAAAPTFSPLTGRPNFIAPTSLRFDYILYRGFPGRFEGPRTTWAPGVTDHARLSVRVRIPSFDTPMPSVRY